MHLETFIFVYKIFSGSKLRGNEKTFQSSQLGLEKRKNHQESLKTDQKTVFS